MRVIDIGLSIPEFVIMIALASFFHPSIWNLVIAITLIKWMNYTSVTRGIVNSEMNYSYIKMAKLFNVSTFNILFKHLLPKVIPSILVIMVVDFGKIILYISSLSFLGLGHNRLLLNGSYASSRTKFHHVSSYYDYCTSHTYFNHNIVIQSYW